MGFDRGRRGRGRDKRDGFGEEGFDLGRETERAIARAHGFGIFLP